MAAHGRLFGCSSRLPWGAQGLHWHTLSTCPPATQPVPHLLPAPPPPQVEALITTKLEELAASGFSSTAIEAAMNTIEFSLRENNTGSFPRGLSLMLRAVGAWIYDRDPFTQMQVRSCSAGAVRHDCCAVRGYGCRTRVGER